MAIQNGIMQLDGGLQLRGGTKADLQNVNPEVKQREIMVETDTNRIKIGYGTYIERDPDTEEFITHDRHWNNLPYVGGIMSREFEGNLDNIYDIISFHNSVLMENYITPEEFHSSISPAYGKTKFKNIFPGTTIINGDNDKYIVLDVGYYDEDSVIVMKKSLFDYPEIIMNPITASEFTTGGYYGISNIRNKLASSLEDAISFFGDYNVRTMSMYLCDGISNGEPTYNLYDTRTEAATLQQVFGDRFYSTSVFNNLNNNRQFSYFRLSPRAEKSNMLLRDVTSADGLWKVGHANSDYFPKKITINGDNYYSFTVFPYFSVS